MRYISDLHIGKVNPKHFDFGLNIDTKKYNLPSFVKENVVNAPDVATALVTGFSGSFGSAAVLTRADA